MTFFFFHFDCVFCETPSLTSHPNSSPNGRVLQGSAAARRVFNTVSLDSCVCACVGTLLLMLVQFKVTSSLTPGKGGTALVQTLCHGGGKVGASFPLFPVQYDRLSIFD